jgi:hypothetical protein
LGFGVQAALCHHKKAAFYTRYAHRPQRRIDWGRGWYVYGSHGGLLRPSRHRCLAHFRVDRGGDVPG